ncbi:hypothetical protein HK405_008967, partial [Cladochytrium tenue]
MAAVAATTVRPAPPAPQEAPPAAKAATAAATADIAGDTGLPPLASMDTASPGAVVAPVDPLAIDKSPAGNGGPSPATAAAPSPLARLASRLAGPPAARPFPFALPPISMAAAPLAATLRLLDDIPAAALHRALLGLAALLFFSPRLFLAALLLAVGAAAGVLASNANERDSPVAKADAERLRERVALMEFDAAIVEKEELEFKRALHVPSEVDAELTKFLNFFVRDFINNWYAPLNVSNSPEFPSTIFTSMRQTLVTLGFSVARMKLPAAFSSVSQSLIDHMREYKAFESSSLPLEVYLSRNPASPFNQYSDPASIHQLLRQLSAHMIMTCLPRADRHSPVVFSFLREIMATSVLLSLVDLWSDPDYINQALVSYIKGELKRKAEEEEELRRGGVSAGLEFDAAGEFSGAGLHTRAPPNVVKSASSDPTGDQLLIKVVEARHMPATGAGGAFYCALQVGRHMLRTRKVPSESNPVWVEDFQFDWKKPALQDEAIIVNVYDAKILRDDLIGSVMVPTATLKPNKFTKSWFSIDASDHKASTGNAELLLEIMVISINIGMESDDEDIVSEALLRRSSSKLDQTGSGLAAEDPQDSNGAGASAAPCLSQAEMEPLLHDPEFVTYLFDNQLARARQLYLLAQTLAAEHVPSSSSDATDQDDVALLDERLRTQHIQLVLFANMCRECPPDLLARCPTASAAAAAAPEPMAVTAVAAAMRELASVLGQEAAMYLQNNPRAAAEAAAFAAAAAFASRNLDPDVPPMDGSAEPLRSANGADTAPSPPRNVGGSPPALPVRPPVAAAPPDSFVPAVGNGRAAQLVADISALKEQMVEIDLAAESASPRRAAELVEMKLQMIDRIQTLVDALNDLESGAEDADADDASGVDDDEVVDDSDSVDAPLDSEARAEPDDAPAATLLVGARVRVSWDGASGVVVPSLAPPTLRRSTGLESPAAPLTFVVEVERPAAFGAATGGWILTRSVADFALAHRALASADPATVRANRLPPPPPSALAVVSSAAAAAAAADAERWVSAVLADPVL